MHAATPAGWSHFDEDRWELYHIEADRSQCHDLAAEEPEKLEEMKALWFAEAAKYNGLPLADLNILETMTRSRPYLVGDRDHFTYYPNTAEVGIGAAVEIRGQSFSVMAEVTVDTTGAEGVMFKQGGAHGGHVLFIQDGRLHYVYNFIGEEEQKISSSGAVPMGKHVFGVRYDAAGPSKAATPRSGRPRSSSTTLPSRSLADIKVHPGTFGLAGASLSRRAQQRIGGFQFLQGSVCILRRNDPAGGRRRLRKAVRGRREGVGAGLREGLAVATVRGLP